MIPAEALERFEIGDSDGPTFIESLEVWLVPFPNHPQLSRPLSRSAKCINKSTETDVRVPLPASPIPEYPARLNWPHTGQQLQHSEARDVVASILGPTQDAHDVLHMRRFEKLEAAVFHERDVAATELDFEQVGVMGRTHQDGLVVQGDPGLSVLQHPFYYMVGLRLLILRGHEDRLLL